MMPTAIGLSTAESINRSILWQELALNSNLIVSVNWFSQLDPTPHGVLYYSTDDSIMLFVIQIVQLQGFAVL
jgi:hypothetical protein